MVSMNITIKDGKNKKREAVVKFDAEKFERLAAVFGLFNSDFLKSLARAERDIKTGRVREIKSLRELRK